MRIHEIFKHLYIYLNQVIITITKKEKFITHFSYYFDLFGLINLKKNNININ